MMKKTRFLVFKGNTVIVILCLAESLSISISLGSDDVENNILAFLSSECISQKRCYKSCSIHLRGRISVDMSYFTCSFN